MQSSMPEPPLDNPLQRLAAVTPVLVLGRNVDPNVRVPVVHVPLARRVRSEVHGADGDAAVVHTGADERGKGRGFGLGLVVVFVRCLAQIP